jgi:hypothetical protein
LPAAAALVAALLLLSDLSHAHNFLPSVVIETGQPVYGLVCDNLEGDGSPECACLRADGSVLLCSPSDAWAWRQIHAGGDSARGIWDRPTIDTGDLQLDHPGAEIVVFSEYKLYVLHREPGGEWVPELVYDHSGYVGDCWGARAGDYDPSHPGDEAFSIIEGVLDCSVGLVHAHSDGAWRDSLVYSAEVGMDSEAGEFDHDHPGPEIILPTEMGFTYEIRPSEATTGSSGAHRLEGCGGGRDLWPAWCIWIDMEQSGWVVEIGDVDVSHPGNEVVFGTRYSNSFLVQGYDGAGQHPYEVVFTGETTPHPRSIWDVALGDFLAESPGLEIAGVDQSGHVYLVWRESGEWHGETVWTDTGSPLYAVAACDVDAGSPGDDMLVAGQSGELILLSRVLTGAPADTDSREPGLSWGPNPVTGATSITLSQPLSGHVRLSVHDVRGRRVAVLVDGRRPAGVSHVVWPATDGRGRPFPSGVYFVRFETESGVATRKLVLMR